MLKGKFLAFTAKFKEPIVDGEGNVRRDKNGEIMYCYVWRVVRYRCPSVAR